MHPALVMPSMSVYQYNFFKKNSNKVICTPAIESNSIYADIDECARSDEYPCHGDCRNTVGDYDCKCRTGYQPRGGGPKIEPKVPSTCTNCSRYVPSNQSISFIGGTKVLCFILKFEISRRLK